MISEREKIRMLRAIIDTLDDEGRLASVVETICGDEDSDGPTADDLARKIDGLSQMSAEYKRLPGRMSEIERQFNAATRSMDVFQKQLMQYVDAHIRQGHERP